MNRKIIIIKEIEGNIMIKMITI